MCGGGGRRLGKLTANTPKPLMTLSGKSILEWKLEHYLALSYKKIILCIGYQGNKIEKLIKDKFEGILIRDSGVEAGILRRLADVRDNLAPIILVSYGDTFAKINLDNLLATHIENRTLVTLVVAPITNPFGILNWDTEKFVTSFEEKPTLNHFIGYFVMNREAFEHIHQEVLDMPDGEGVVEMFQMFVEMKQVKIYEFSGLKFSINTPSDLEDARSKIGNFFTLDETRHE